MKYRNICKNCGKRHNNGTNFCTRKCRMAWIREHQIKGAKKKYGDGKWENEIACRHFGMTSSALDKSSIGR